MILGQLRNHYSLFESLHWGATLIAKREIEKLFWIFVGLISRLFELGEMRLRVRDGQKLHSFQCICNTLWGTVCYNNEHAGKLSYLPELSWAEPSQAELSWAENKMLFSDEAGLFWWNCYGSGAVGRWALLVGTDCGFGLFESESVLELELELQLELALVSVCVSNTVALSCVDIVANED